MYPGESRVKKGYNRAFDVPAIAAGVTYSALHGSLADEERT
jgi:hypothetical protein